MDKKYKVESRQGGVWHDAGWRLGKRPMRYSDPDQAQADIRVYVADCKREAAENSMAEVPSVDDFRVVEMQTILFPNVRVES